MSTVPYFLDRRYPFRVVYRYYCRLTCRFGFRFQQGNRYIPRLLFPYRTRRLLVQVVPNTYQHLYNNNRFHGFDRRQGSVCNLHSRQLLCQQCLTKGFPAQDLQRELRRNIVLHQLLHYQHMLTHCQRLRLRSLVERRWSDIFCSLL